MSSILRALKKLDEESMLQRSESKGESESERERERENQAGGQKIKMINKFLAALSALLLLGIAGWLIIHSPAKPVLENKMEKEVGNKVENKVEKKQDTSSLKPPSPAISPPIPSSNDAPPRESRPELSGAEQPKPSTEALDLKNNRPPQPIRTETVKNTNPTGLNLTGILWSQVPGKRLALINDLYLREGDEIKGAAIIRIEKNEVTLQSATKTWTIGLKK